MHLAAAKLRVSLHCILSFSFVHGSELLDDHVQQASHSHQTGSYPPAEQGFAQHPAGPDHVCLQSHLTGCSHSSSYDYLGTMQSKGFMHKAQLQGLHLARLRDVPTATVMLNVRSACTYSLSCCEPLLTCATHCHRGCVTRSPGFDMIQTTPCL